MDGSVHQPDAAYGVSNVMRCLSKSPLPPFIKGGWGGGEQGRGRLRKVSSLGPVEPLASCLHDIARVYNGHAEGGKIDIPVFVMGRGDEDELVVS